MYGNTLTRETSNDPGCPMRFCDLRFVCLFLPVDPFVVCASTRTGYFRTGTQNRSSIIRSRKNMIHFLFLVNG